VITNREVVGETDTEYSEGSCLADIWKLWQIAILALTLTGNDYFR